MKVKMLRGTVIRHDGGQAFTVEPGEVIEVNEEFGSWLISRQKAQKLPEPTPDPREGLRPSPTGTGKENADLPAGEKRQVTARGGKKK